MPPHSLPPDISNSFTLTTQHKYQQDTTSQLPRIENEPNTLTLLAAWSNFKLAQLTFAPPDIHTLRRSAIIKNAIQHIYNLAPVDGLDQMTRWEFFTLESLDQVDMTQEVLETILSEYIRIMDLPKSVSHPAKVKTTKLEQSTTSNEDRQPRSKNEVNKTEYLPNTSTDSNLSYAEKYPTTTLSHYFTPPPPPPSLPPTKQDTVDDYPKGNRLNPKRISWTCDTGLPSLVASQHFAGELISLFDMEFKVDITLDINSTSAPQLPELAHLTEKQQRRSSVDSFMRLLPAFESFQVDGHGVSKASKCITSLSKNAGGDLPNRRTTSPWVPARSSSLKYRSVQQPSPPTSPNSPMSPESSGSLLSISSSPSTGPQVSPPPAPVTLPRPSVKSSSNNTTPPSLYAHDLEHNPSEKIVLQCRKPSLTRKKSIRRLASMLGKRNSNSATTLPLDRHEFTSPTTTKVTSKLMIEHPSSDKIITNVNNTTSPYNAITTPFSPLPSLEAPLHIATDTASFSKTLPSLDRTISTSMSPAEALQVYSNSGTLLSPLSSIATSSPSTRSHRRRSKSVPEIPLFIHTPIHTIQKQRYKYLEDHEHLVPFERTGSDIIFQRTVNHPSTRVTLSRVNTKQQVSKEQPTQSIPASKQKPDLNRSQTASRPPQPHRHKMYSGHSAQGISLIGVLDNHGSISPSSTESPKSSFLKRMTSFARRKKSVSSTTYHGIQPPVYV